MIILFYIKKNIAALFSCSVIILLLLAMVIFSQYLLATLFTLSVLLVSFYVYNKRIKSGINQIESTLESFSQLTSIDTKSLSSHSKLATLSQNIQSITKSIFNEKNDYIATFNSINDAVVRTDIDGNILFINKACKHLLNMSEDKLLGTSFTRLKTQIMQDVEVESFENVLSSLKSTFTSNKVNTSISKIKVAGKYLSVEQHVKGVFSQEGAFLGSVVLLRDVTRAEQLRVRLKYQANHDSVTKLFNRYKFEQKLVDAWHDAHENKKNHALLQLDMDRFKLINDNAGHAAGDQLLREVGQLLKLVVHQKDICARIGGDEFSVLLYNASKTSTLAMMETLNDAFKQLSFSYNGQVFEVGASIGATLINELSPPLVEVKKEADAACYVAKNQGINCFQLFDHNDENLVTHQQEPRWAARINQALEKDEFELYYQPIKALNKKHQSKQHIEILLRLRNDDQLLSPHVFLPAVERFRFSSKVDHWVMTKTFLWLSEQPQLWENIVVAINLSGDSITNEPFIDSIIRCYKNYQFPASAICFEVTETAAIANMTMATKMVEKLRFAGFAIALDDFGKGFSTFSYLKSLPAQYIKIDGSYVQDILSNPCDLAIVKAIHTMAKTLEILTVAEFVQCEETTQLLCDIGVDFVQGFGIAEPAALNDYANNFSDLRFNKMAG